MIREHGPSRDYPLGSIRVKMTHQDRPDSYGVIDLITFRDPETGKVDSRAAMLKARAMELDFKAQATQDKIQKRIDPGSLKFAAMVAHYRKGRGQHVYSSIVADLERSLGNSTLEGLEDDFSDFLKEQQGRKLNREVWVKPEDSWEKKPATRTISESTIKAYKRYFRAIVNAAIKAPRSSGITIPQDPRTGLVYNPARSVVVGKPERRHRPPLDWEVEKLVEVIGNEDPEFLPAFNFARTMPIRRRDQFERLLWANVDQVNLQIQYKPMKTENEETSSGATAYPLILPHMREFILSRIGDEECPTIFWRWGSKSLQENPRKRYPVGDFKKRWERWLRKAGVQDLRWNDLRHDATDYLLSLDLTKREVMVCAGWTTEQMVDWYDTRNRERFSRTVRDKIKAAPEAVRKEVV